MRRPNLRPVVLNSISCFADDGPQNLDRHQLAAKFSDTTGLEASPFRCGVGIDHSVP